MATRHRGRARRRVPDALTLRQRAFLLSYLSGPPGIRGNALAAARDAGYSTKSRAAGAQILDTPVVKAKIDDYCVALDVRPARVLAELARIGFSDLRDVASWNGTVTLKASTEIPDHAASAIAEVRDTEHGVAIKLHDKLGALREMVKILKLAEEEPPPVGGTTTVINAAGNVNVMLTTEERIRRIEALMTLRRPADALARNGHER